MPRTPDQQIHELVQRFTSDLIKVVRDTALASFASAFELHGELGSAPGLPARRGPGRPRKQAVVPVVGRRRAKGGKRDPKVIAQLTEKLAAHVAAHAGQNILEIGKRLGASTHDLQLPTKKLLDAKRIKKRGQRKETRYFPV